jgi:hypothetical protein
MRFRTLLIAFALLLLPAAAQAAPRGGGVARHPAEATQQVRLKGTNGYEIGIEVLNGRRFKLSAVSVGKGLAIEGVEYKLPLRRPSAPREIVARLGHLGQVDVHFVPDSTKRVKVPRGCDGAPGTDEKGHYVGVISFHGEAGFTRVDATRAQGEIFTEPARRCSHPVKPVEQPSRRDLAKKVVAGESKEGEEEGEVETLKLAASGTNPATSFEATRIGVTRKDGTKVALVNFLVTAKRRLGQIEEEGIAVILFAKGSSFLVPEPRDPKSDLVIQPPAPFTGSATFRQETPTRSHWSGNLKVDVPGFGLIPLAGSRSEAKATVKRGG